ncbi:MAG: MFS transporter [Planctomycetota bacterium]
MPARDVSVEDSQHCESPRPGARPGPWRLFPGWWMVGIAASAQFMSGAGQSYGVAAFKDPMRADLKISETSFSLAYSFATLLSGICLPFVGRLVDRYGARRVLPSIAVFLGLACWWMSQVSSLTHLYLGFGMIRSFGQGALTLVSMWIVGEWFVGKRGLATAIAGLGGSLSAMSFPLLNGVLIETWGWHATWIILGCMAWGVLLLPSLLWLRDRPEDVGLHPDGRAYPEDHGHDEPTSRSPGGREFLPTKYSWTVGQVLRDLTFWKLLCIPITAGMIITGLTFHQVAVLGTRGVSTVAALGLISFQAMIATCCSLPAGWLSDRVAGRRLLSGAMLMLAGSSTIVLLMPSPKFAILYAILLGLHGALIRSTGNVIWLNYYGRTYQGGVRGIAMSAMILAAALGPLPFALSIDYFGTYTPALLAFIAIPLTSAVIVATTGPPRRPEVAQTDS